MKKILKWNHKVGGNCPIQADGIFLDYYFYFRSRGERSIIEFSHSENEWEDDSILETYILYNTKFPKAGWLPKWKCKILIYKGLIKFWLKRKK